MKAFYDNTKFQYKKLIRFKTFCPEKAKTAEHWCSTLAS